MKHLENNLLETIFQNIVKKRIKMLIIIILFMIKSERTFTTRLNSELN